MFFEICVLKNSAIFTGKPLHWSLEFRPARLLKKTLIQWFPCEIYSKRLQYSGFPVKFVKFFWIPISENIYERLLLSLIPQLTGLIRRIILIIIFCHLSKSMRYQYSLTSSWKQLMHNQRPQECKVLPRISIKNQYQINQAFRKTNVKLKKVRVVIMLMMLAENLTLKGRN